MPRIAGGKDIITQPLYDTQQYPAAGTAGPLTFFQTPKGQGTTLFGTGVKNLTDTNMRSAGQLPSPWTHEVLTVQVYFQSAGADTLATLIADIALVFKVGHLVLNIGSKQYLELPIAHLPGGAGLHGFAATTTAATNLQAVQSGLPDPRAVFVLSRSITLLENENFDVQLFTPSAPTPTSAVNIRVVLAGELARSIQ